MDRTPSVPTAYDALLARLDPRDGRCEQLADTLKALPGPIDHLRLSTVLVRAYKYEAHRRCFARKLMNQIIRRLRRKVERTRKKLEKAIAEAIRYHTLSDGDETPFAAKYRDFLAWIDAEDPTLGHPAFELFPRRPRGNPPRDWLPAIYEEMKAAGVRSKTKRVEILQLLSVLPSPS